MAIAFCKASVLGRSSGGRSVAAHIAYRAGLCLTGTNNYAPRQDNVVADYFVGWAGTHQQFADAVEASERRKDAQLVRELVWSLPHDCTDAERAEIVKQEAESLRERYGVAVHVSVHRPRRKDADASGFEASGLNHHAHLTITLRAVDTAGKFVGNKLREMNDRGWLDREKDRLVGLVNGVAKTKASRELKYGVPVPTLGRAYGMERRGIETDAGDRWQAWQAQQQEQEQLKAQIAADEIEAAALKAAAERQRLALVEADRLAKIAAAKVAAEAERQRLAVEAASKAAAEKAERERLAQIEAARLAAKAEAERQQLIYARQQSSLAAAAAENERRRQLAAADLADALNYAADAIERAQAARDGVGQDQPRISPDAAGARPGTSRGGVVARLVERVRGLARRCRARIGRRCAVRAGRREALDTPRIGQGVVDKGLKPAGVPFGGNQRRGHEDPVISGTGGRTDRGAQSTNATAGQTVTPAPERFSAAWFAAMRDTVKAELAEKAAPAPATPPAVLDRLAAIRARAEAEARGPAPAPVKPEPAQVRAAIKQDLKPPTKKLGR